MEYNFNMINTSNNFITGINRNKEVKSNDWIVYTTAKMDTVKIYSAYFTGTNNEKRKIEIYYPSNFKFDEKIPAILLFSIKKSSMLRGSFVSWAELLAAKGMAAITYEAIDYEDDFKLILKYIFRNEAYLSINIDRIGVLAFCGALNRYFRMDINEIFKYYHLAYGIFFSGTIAPPSKLKYPFPLLIVNSGNDYKVCKQSYSRFKNEADRHGVDYTIIDFPEGIHRFDVFQATEESKKTIKKMLKKIQIELL